MSARRPPRWYVAMPPFIGRGDELDARIRALEAERLRPVPPPPRTNPRINLHDLAELCEVLGEDDEFERPPE
ncbi:hypothetical protein [Actinomadura sp. 21ATH]|uniref:hypothetical protein n=1 Tax=Actinomadura sp. 21ATH TaxID=1735444 RepID=UPI0035C16234